MKLFKSRDIALGLFVLFCLAFIASCSKKTMEIHHQQPYGSYLTDKSGRSVYMFLKDSKEKSKCHNQCAEEWPPVLANKHVLPGDGVDGPFLSILKRNNGDTQVTYYGHPLYYYKGDTKTGDAKGQGKKEFGGEWYLVKPNGKKLDNVHEK